jgi:hypothetical protein
MKHSPAALEKKNRYRDHSSVAFASFPLSMLQLAIGGRMVASD